MSNTPGAQRGGGTGNSFDEQLGDLQYPQPSVNGHKRDFMDLPVAPYPSVSPSTAMTQKVQPQKERRPVLPTSIVTAYAAGAPPIQRMPSQPTLPEQGLHRHIQNANNGMAPGPPGHPLDLYKSHADNQRRPPEQMHRDEPSLNFQYERSTPDSNQSSEKQQQHGPYQAHGQQIQQQTQHTMQPLSQKHPSSSVVVSPTAPHPPPTNGLSRKPSTSQAPAIHPNFQYENNTLDSNQARGQQQHGRPYIGQQQPQQTLPPLSQRQSSSLVASSSSTPHPLPINAPPRKPSTSQAPAIHPDAIKVAANALTPIQHLYEEAWVRTVASVQHEISRMHSELTKLLEVERRQNQMMRTERDAALEEAKRLRGENAEMKEGAKRAETEVQRVMMEREEQFRRLQENNEVLHRQGQVQMLRAQAGERAQKDAMNSTVESIRSEFAKQFEVEMAVKLRELQEQKTMRVLAEKKLAEATRQLKGMNGSFSASQFYSEQERQGSESATLIGTPERQILKFKDEREDDSGRESNPIARGDRVFGSHQSSRSTSISPLTQTSSPQIKQEPVSIRLATPPQHPPLAPSRQYLIPASPHPHPSEIPQTYHNHNHDQRNRPPVLRLIVTSDDQLRAKGPEERLPSSEAPRPDLNQHSPRSVTPVPSSVPLSPPPSERRPPLAKIDHHSPSPEGSRARARSTSLLSNLKQSPVPHHAFPLRPEHHSLPPLARPGAAHNRSAACHSPSSPQRQRPATAASPVVPPFVAPPSPGSDQRARKRGRSEFERDGGNGDRRMEMGEYRRSVSVRSITDQSDDRERSRPRPRLDETHTNVQLATPTTRSAFAFGQSSPNALASSSSSMGAGLLEEGELLATPEENAGHEAGEIDMVDVKPQIEKAPSARARPNKIGINHMDLLYETRGDKMICRMCRSRPKDAAEKLSPPASFSTKATWAELVGHCKTGHPKDWGDLERLSPSQIGELRHRMATSSSSGFMLK